MTTDDAPATVLLLDDDSMVTSALEGLLLDETEFEVVAFNDPAAALETAAAREVDAVVSDFLMPGMDGLTFLHQMREIRPFAARILLTGYADKRNAIRSINEVGLYHYLEKPWDNDQLLLVVRNAVERTRLLQRTDEVVRQLAERDRSLNDLRSRLLKAIL